VGKSPFLKAKLQKENYSRSHFLTENKNHTYLVCFLTKPHTKSFDPANELVHLYEIRDALSEKFGSQSKARRELVITREQWNGLGALADRAPLREGRHRGKHPGRLRDATSEELNEARSIAKSMIHACH
jgi:hypothetical protein